MYIKYSLLLVMDSSKLIINSSILNKRYLKKFIQAIKIKYLGKTETERKNFTLDVGFTTMKNVG